MSRPPDENEQPKPAAPEPRVFTSKPSTSFAKRAAIILVAGMVVGLVAALFRPDAPKQPQQAAPEATGATGLRRPAVGAAEASAVAAGQRQAPALVNASKLRGKGLTIAEFVNEIKPALAGVIAWQDKNVEANHGKERLCEYEGDDELSVDDALDLLRFVGLSFVHRQPGVMEIDPTDSTDRLWQLLVGDADTDSLTWGALRPWRKLTIKREESQNDTTLAVRDDGIIPFDPIRTGFISGAFTDSIEHARWIAMAVGGMSVTVTEGLVEQLEHPDEQALHTERVLYDGTPVSQDYDPAKNKVAFLAAILTGIWRDEFLGRRLDETNLGVADWTKRRDLHDQVRAWLVASANRKDFGTDSPEYAAAWLRCAETFRPQGDIESYAAALRATLAQSSVGAARALALEFSIAKRPERFIPQPEPPTLVSVAGPLWRRFSFTFAQALKMLDSEDAEHGQPTAGLPVAHDKLTRAVLWRLSRVASGQPEDNPDDEAAPALAAKIAGIARSSASPTTRRLALEALYRERGKAQPDQPRWRLAANPNLALAAFLEDRDTAVQNSAAEFLPAVAGPFEINKLTDSDLETRVPEAVSRLMTGLVRQIWTDAAPPEAETAALEKLLNRLLDSSVETLAVRAAWGKMHNPAVSLANRVRAAKSFHTPAQRVQAVQGLGELHPPHGSAAAAGPDATLQQKMVSVFLFDDTPVVRAAVFNARLPAKLPKSDRLELYQRGLADADDSVKLAVLKELTSSPEDHGPELVATLKVLLDSHPSDDIKAVAAELLNRR